ncbi:Acyl-coenzyme A thioesterase 9 mitochondrial [Bienertia sinuspersici]
MEQPNSNYSSSNFISVFSNLPKPFEDSRTPGENDGTHKPLSLWPGMYHSPVTIALWETRSKIFEIMNDPSIDGPPQTQLLTKTPSQSRMTVLYNFSSDFILREQYRDPWNDVRIGKLLEDLDALAGTISVKHCSDVDYTTRPLLLVTASVDRIVLKKPISVENDLRISGSVIWVGKRKRGQNIREYVNKEVDRLKALLSEGRIFCDMPALADRNSILLRDTRLANSMICQPQQRNIHGRIFGGFLMHRAFELAFSTAYAFAGVRPSFLEVDHVDFLKPVDVGDFLRFKSCVLYTELEDPEHPLINVEVEAHVTRPELRSSEVSNTFYFTFTICPEAKAEQNRVIIRNVVAATEEEARHILERRDAKALQVSKCANGGATTITEQ